MTSFRKLTKAIKAMTSPTKKTVQKVDKMMSIRRLTEDEFTQLESAQATRDILEAMRGCPFTEDDINHMPEFGPLRTPPVFDADFARDTGRTTSWTPPQSAIPKEVDEFWTAVIEDVAREMEEDYEDFENMMNPPQVADADSLPAYEDRDASSPPYRSMYPRLDDLPAYDDLPAPTYEDLKFVFSGGAERLYPRLDDLPAYSYYY